MEDMSELWVWQPKQVMNKYENNPLTIKILKIKLQKIYQISSFNESEYLCHVIDAYKWVKYVSTQQKYDIIFENDKTFKYFLQQFIWTSIKNLILCKSFKLQKMMIYTQHLMKQSLKVFSKFFYELQKYPKMILILKQCFEIQKQFFRTNFIINYHPYILLPQKEQIQNINAFTRSLKAYDKVDILKIDQQHKLMCWLPGIIKKTSIYSSLTVKYDYQKKSSLIQPNSLQIRPYQSKKQQYQWRFALKAGDLIDYSKMMRTWVSCSVVEVIKQKDDEDQQYIKLKVCDQCDNEYFPYITDPKIQRYGSIKKMRGDGKQQQQFDSDDYNDYIMDPQMSQTFIARLQPCRSKLILDFLNYLHHEHHLFERISKVIQLKQMKIEVTVDLICFIELVHQYFHRQFAVTYLFQFMNAQIQYISNIKQAQIRNFTRERYEVVTRSIGNFMRKLLPEQERKQRMQKLQLNFMLRFLLSNFFDRKLQAVSLLATFFRKLRCSNSQSSQKNFISWISENKILSLIYNDKSHSQLIAKSNQFLKHYLQTKPSTQQLQPLLIWNEAIIKVVDENFDELPLQIKKSVVERIKKKTNVTNPNALSIIKKIPNCQNWLLQNGGQGWVQVVNRKQRHKPDIENVFKFNFNVVNKITKDVTKIAQNRLRTQFFIYLFQINYLCQVFQNQNIIFIQKLKFIQLVSEYLKKLSDQLFKLLLKSLIKNNFNSQLALHYQQFFIKLMPKLQFTHLNSLFQQKFTTQQSLLNLTMTQFNIFKKCFIDINHSIKEYQQFQSYRQHKKISNHLYVLHGDISELEGVDKLEWIIFNTKNPQISKNSIIFLGDLLSSSQEEAMSNKQKNKLLANALSYLYEVNKMQKKEKKYQLQQKYLKIIQQIMNQTQLKGVDQVPSINSLFPIQFLEMRVINNFNIIKKKINYYVQSNTTLYQIRSELCQTINALVNQIKLLINGNEIHSRFNGHLIHNLQIDGDIVIEKVKQIPQISLLDAEGNLVQKAKTIFKAIFNEYSSDGLMSKQQCLKFHQRCVGDAISKGELRVDKIFEDHDTDHDGYLTQNDFISFYEASSRKKQKIVWSNLQSFGARSDLQTLDSIPTFYPQRDTLARNKLYDDHVFMKVLFQLLASSHKTLALEAWKLASRLPLYQRFQYNLDLSKEYLTCYWLHVTQSKRQFYKITKEVLSAVLRMSVETVCIGLKVALQCQSIDVSIFNIIIENLKAINSSYNINFYQKVILEYSLRIFNRFVIKDENITKYYISNYQAWNDIFRKGIMSTNEVQRQKFCSCFSQLIELSIEKDFKLFQCLFILIYRIFDSYNLSTLTVTYFQLFSKLLTVLREHQQLMEKLQLNWRDLSQQIVNIYKSHECTQTSMTSKPDQVAEGLLKIIIKLLNEDTLDCIENLVQFIFQQSLFPEKGKNKLKTSKSRLDAYNLIYEICKYKKKDGKYSKGLQKLFLAGFKDVYKKMSPKKKIQSFSFYYNFNQSRSELGYAGIRNLGCICYMISMLQQLYMTIPFRNLILMANDQEPQNMVKKGGREIDDNLFHQLKTMFGYLLLTEKQQYNPQQFCFSFKDLDGMSVNTLVQQDAQQFLNIFFDKMETSLKNTPFKHIFQNIFGGQICNQMTCKGCGAVKQKIQSFYPLSLQIKGYKNIDESFKKYIQCQNISEYQCDSCKSKCDVTKRNFLQKTPNYFIIHLQRMCFNYDRLQNEKVNTRWQFPHQLDVYDYTISKEKGISQKNNQFTYNLIGIVVHFGTADFGHYFSYRKQNQNLWLEFNDQRVRQFDPSDIQVECFGGQNWRKQSQSAYLLVYERQYKTDVILQFTSEQQKKKIIEQYKLASAIIIQQKFNKNDSQSRVSKYSSYDDGNQNKSNKQQLIQQKCQDQEKQSTLQNRKDNSNKKLNEQQNTINQQNNTKQREIKEQQQSKKDNVQQQTIQKNKSSPKDTNEQIFADQHSPIHCEQPISQQKQSETTLNDQQSTQQKIIKVQKQSQTLNDIQQSYDLKEIQNIKFNESQKQNFLQISTDQIKLQNKLQVHLDMHKICQYIPKTIKDKVDQQNDQFSFTMNLSNNQFFLFIYNILSIPPPESLRLQFLQLCYQCSHLKQSIKLQQHKIIPSSWAHEKFQQLIQGYGWKFFQKFSKNWLLDDILHTEKSTRIVIKCLFQSVIKDIIIQNNNFKYQKDEVNSETKNEKKKKVQLFLKQYKKMMLNQVIENWPKFEQYFELWISLIQKTQFVLNYCKQKQIMLQIFQLILQQQFPCQRTSFSASKMIIVSSQPCFQYPLHFMYALLENGYDMNEKELKCFEDHSFMKKIITNRVENFNISMIENLCKDNSINSQKMGLLLLKESCNVRSNTEQKLIIASIEQYIKIEDGLKEKRLQWILGFPFYVEHRHSVQKGFGSYGCFPLNEPAVKYISALGHFPPILQQISAFKNKPFIANQLISMILQFQNLGIINNLGQYPSRMATTHSYLQQLQHYIERSYESSQKQYTIHKINIEYGQRLKSLWDDRQKRQMKNPFPKILLGKITEQEKVREDQFQVFTITQYNVKTYYLSLQSSQTEYLNIKNILFLKGNKNFICSNFPKQYKGYGYSKCSSSSQQDNQLLPNQQIFNGAKQDWLLRRVEITNNSNQSMLVVLQIQNPQQCNLHLPIGPFSIQIKFNSTSQLVLIKKNFDKEYGDLKIGCDVLGRATTSDNFPKQIITKIYERAQQSNVENFNDEDDGDYCDKSEH